MPTDLHQALQLALQHHRHGQLEQAESIYRQILSLQPDDPGVLHLLGSVAFQAGRHEAAAELFRRAIAARPGVAEYHSNLGEALGCLGHLDQAFASLQTAVRLDPNFPEAYINLGNLFRVAGALQHAVAAYQTAIQLRPQAALAHYDLAVTLADGGAREPALAAYRAAIERDPKFALAHDGLGTVLRELGQLDEALAAHRAALALQPNNADVYNNLGNAFKDAGRLDDAIACFRHANALAPTPGAHSNLIYALHFHPDGERQLAEEQQQWARRYSPPAATLGRHPNARDPDRRLRIGYVSPNFFDHVVGVNLLPLFEHHDRGRFEIIVYSDVLCPDAITARFRPRADLWRQTVGLTDEQLAAQIRLDAVDVLVDLTQHLARNRLRTFAMRPAPVQVSFAGYPAGTGLPAIRYRLTDPHLDPPLSDSPQCGEIPIRLPHSFWCYAPNQPVLPGVNDLPALSHGGAVTFGCLNNFCKITAPTLHLWARVLAAVDRSTLLLRAPAGSPRDATLDTLRQFGVDPNRVRFVGAQPRPAYLATYHHIDVALDTFPYNGHTTSLDALWMGVPVVTIAGHTSVARAGLSQLTNLGLADLAADSADDFIHIASALATDLPRLGQLRATLRPRMAASPLMDACGFARGIEQAYRRMWRNYCAHPPGD